MGLCSWPHGPVGWYVWCYSYGIGLSYHYSYGIGLSYHSPWPVALYHVLFSCCSVAITHGCVSSASQTPPSVRRNKLDLVLMTEMSARGTVREGHDGQEVLAHVAMYHRYARTHARSHLRTRMLVRSHDRAHACSLARSRTHLLACSRTRLLARKDACAHTREVVANICYGPSAMLPDIGHQPSAVPQGLGPSAMLPSIGPLPCHRPYAMLQAICHRPCPRGHRAAMLPIIGHAIAHVPCAICRMPCCGS